MLRAALVGLPLVGKTTIFSLLTGRQGAVSGYQAKPETHQGIAAVPDPRLEVLTDMFKPKQTTPAQIEFLDIPGVAPGAGAAARRFLTEIREVDAIVCVLRAFDDAGLGLEPAAPARDAENLDLELFFADLEVVQRRLERLKGTKKKEEREEAEVLQRCEKALEDGVRIGTLTFSDEEKRILRGFTFLTSKPLLFVVNCDESGLEGGYPGQDELEKLAATREIPILTMSARIELEVAELDREEREPFLAAIGLTEPGIVRLTRLAYDALGLISFLTAGEDEVRAWTVERGASARAAAGKIHSDIERGFIRAEVVAFSDLAATGSMLAAREAGKVRLEGKEYIVQDGDIMNIRFHV